MADFVSNVALGRVRTYYDNVNDNNPANSALIVVPLEATGIVADDTLKDYDDLAALLAGATNEQTTMGRKTLTDADLAASAQDDTNNRLDLDLPDVTWTGATGNAISDVVVCYDPDTTAGTDSTVIPVFFWDFAVTPDGSDVVLQVNAAGAVRVTSP